MKLYTLKQRAAADLKKVAAGRIHPRQTFLLRRSLSFFPIPDEFIMRTSCVNICRTKIPQAAFLRRRLGCPLHIPDNKTGV